MDWVNKSFSAVSEKTNDYFKDLLSESTTEIDDPVAGLQQANLTIKQLNTELAAYKRRLSVANEEINEIRLRLESVQLQQINKDKQHANTVQHLKQEIQRLVESDFRGEPEGESEYAIPLPSNNDPKPSTKVIFDNFNIKQGVHRSQLPFLSKENELKVQVDNADGQEQAHINNFAELERLRDEVKKWYNIARERKEAAHSAGKLQEQVAELTAKLDRYDQERCEEIAIIQERMNQRVADLRNQVLLYRKKWEDATATERGVDGCTQTDPPLSKNTSPANLLREPSEKSTNGSQDDFDDGSSMMSMQTRQLDEMMNQLEHELHSVDLNLSNVSHSSNVSQPVDSRNRKLEALGSQLASLRRSVRARGRSAKSLPPIQTTRVAATQPTCECPKFISKLLCVDVLEVNSLEKMISAVQSRLKTPRPALDNQAAQEAFLRDHLAEVLAVLPDYELDEVLAEPFGQLCLELVDQGFDLNAYAAQDGSAGPANNLEAEVAILKGLLEQSEQARRLLEKRNNDLDTKELQKNIQELDAEKNSLQEVLLAERERSSSKITALEASLSEKLVVIDELEVKMSANASASGPTDTELEEKLQQITQSFTKQQVDVAQWTQQWNVVLTEREQRIVALQQQIESVSAELKRSTDELQRLREHLQEKEQQLDAQAETAEEREDQLHRQVLSMEEELQEMRHFRSNEMQLRKELEEAREKHGQLQSEIQSLRGELANLQAVMDNEQAETNFNLVETEAEHREQLNQMQKQVDELREELKKTSGVVEAEVESRVSERATQAEEDFRRVMSMLRQRDQTIVELNEQLNKHMTRMGDHIDKTLMRNVLVGYFRLPPKKRPDAFRMIAHLLNFNEKQVEEVDEANAGLYDRVKRTASHVLQARLDIAAGEDATPFTEQLLNFLEKEAQVKPKLRLPTEYLETSMNSSSSPGDDKVPSWTDDGPVEASPLVIPDLNTTGIHSTSSLTH